MEFNGQTPDIAAENAKALFNLFPEICKDGKIDPNALRCLIGDYIDDSTEEYSFTWNGKLNAIHLAQAPSCGTLRPCPDESKNWNTTKNIYIEGDNLEVLKLLRRSYHNKIKMIYIDPPYNTGKDVVYHDDFHDSIKHYKEITGQIDSKGNKLTTNTESNGRFHTDWLNMMYPRLKLARELLTTDGVMFISIDDGEVAELKKICKEIFGENNVEMIVWEKVADDSGKLKKTYRIRREHEYIVLCYKDINSCFFGKYLDVRNYKNDYNNDDDDPRGPFISGNISETEEVSNKENINYYTVTSPAGVEYTRKFNITKDEFDKLNNDILINKDGKPVSRIYWGKDGKGVPRLKSYINEPKLSTPASILKDLGTAKTAGNLIEELLGDRKLFSNPKPVELLKHLVRIVTDKRFSLNPALSSEDKILTPSVLKSLGPSNSDDIILDFFSGSATTADAIMQVNKEDGGNRKYILIQLPECFDNSEKKNVDFENAIAFCDLHKVSRNIAEIAKERIRVAGNKIKNELSESSKKQVTLDNLDGQQLNQNEVDVGFKVFKLDTSNLMKWQPQTEDINKTVTEYTENIDPERDDIDVVYEIMLKQGISLTEKIEEITVCGKHIYSIGYNLLLVCLDDDITLEVIHEMVKYKPEENLDSWRVIFKDNGFDSDSVKINACAILKAAGLNEDSFITI